MNPEMSESPSISTAAPGAPLRVPVEPKANIAVATIAGAAAALVGAAIWAAVTVATKMEIGWMAVGLGFLVGCAIGYFNPQRSQALAWLGAVLSLVGCLLGNWFSIVGFVSTEKGVSFFQLLGAIGVTQIPGIMADAFSPMDLLFYGIAIYEGYKFSLRGRTKA